MLAIGLAVGAIVAIAVLALSSALILAALAWLAALI
jgi:hypothetical protein